jgi:hypothetical protein
MITLIVAEIVAVGTILFLGLLAHNEHKAGKHLELKNQEVAQ